MFRWRALLGHLLFSDTDCAQAELQYPWQGAPHKLRGFQILATLPRGPSLSSQHRHWPQKPGVLLHISNLTKNLRFWDSSEHLKKNLTLDLLIWNFWKVLISEIQNFSEAQNLSQNFSEVQIFGQTIFRYSDFLSSCWCISKVLTCRQAQWSEYLCQFNLVIRFWPGKLGAKPNTLTRWWDVYPKEGDKGFAWVNPQNLCLVFTSKQLSNSLHATYLQHPLLQASAIMDIEHLHADILTALPSDPITKAHLLDTLNPRWSTDETSYLCLDGRMYIPKTDDLHLCVFRYKHNHPLSGHFGQNHTLELIHCEYTWPGIHTYVKDYVKSCMACTWAKTQHHRPYGMLKQLPVPNWPWNSILMDFIDELPSSSSFTAILVIIDWLSKQVIFIPTHDTITSPELTQLFLCHVFTKHGVPAHVTSNWGSEFVSHFFCSLGKALNMKLHFTLGYHPEGDGQTKRANQTLE